MCETCLHHRYADWMVNNTVAHGLSMYAYSGNTPDWALAPAQKGLGYRFPPLDAFLPQVDDFFTYAGVLYMRCFVR